MSGAKFLKEGTYYEFLINKFLDDGRKDIPWSRLRVGVLGDGSDLVHLTSEASGELSTLAMNTIANLAMQRIAIQMLKETNFGKRYEILYMKGIGDDAEWIGMLKNTPSSDDIDDMLDKLKTIYEEMGHTFSPAKTFVIPLSSEYVQTFARLGLYIPRDQIMMIASEKPRSVRNPHGFLSSFRQLLLAKCARGFSPNYANALLLLYGRELTQLTLRRHIKSYGKDKIAKFRKIRVPGIRSININVSNAIYARVGNSFIADNVPIITLNFSIALFMIPSSAGGCGFCPLLMLVTLTPASFMSFISLYDKPFQQTMFSLLAYMIGKPLNNGESTKTESKIGRVILPEQLQTLRMSDIFSTRVQRNIELH